MGVHTPGPWYADDATNGHLGIWSEQNGALVAVTEQGEREDTTHMTDNEEAANAALIAAAPELYEACRAFLEWSSFFEAEWDVLTDGQTGKPTDYAKIKRIIRTAVAAIEKAEGGQG